MTETSHPLHLVALLVIVAIVAASVMHSMGLIPVPRRSSRRPARGSQSGPVFPFAPMDTPPPTGVFTRESETFRPKEPRR